MTLSTGMPWKLALGFLVISVLTAACRQQVQAEITDTFPVERMEAYAVENEESLTQLTDDLSARGIVSIRIAVSRSPIYGVDKMGERVTLSRTESEDLYEKMANLGLYKVINQELSKQFFIEGEYLASHNGLVSILSTSKPEQPLQACSEIRGQPAKGQCVISFGHATAWFQIFIWSSIQ
ncbi:MAG: hypothetical protein AAF290_07370 [Pseudomonadota bacterium]